MGNVKSKTQPQDGSTVLWSVKARFDLEADVALVAALDEAFVVFGYESRQWRLTKYDLKGRRTGVTASLRHLPGGMAGVTLCGRHCLALSYGRQRTNEDVRQIEFRDASDLGTVLMTYRLGPREPGPLCVPCAPTPPSTLLYLDWGAGSREVGRLDCSSKPLVTTSTTSLGHGGGAWGVCSVWRGDAELLVTLQASPSGRPGVHACNASTGAPAWSGTGAPPGNEHSILPVSIATDGDHVYVSDRGNACVQTFSPEGVYRGAILEEGYGTLGQIAWCDALSALIVIHQRRNAKTARLTAVHIE